MMCDLKWVGIFLITGSMALGYADEKKPAREPSSKVHACEEIYPGAPVSPFTPVMCKLLKKWPPPYGAPQTIEKGSEWLRAIRVDGPDESDRYVGFHRVQIIDAPVSKVIAQNESYDNYSKFLSGVKECRKIGEYGNWVLTRWVRKAPKSFLSDIGFDQMFYVDKSNANRIVFRYQITQSDQVPFSDGLIVFEPAKGGQATRVTSFDFVKPKVAGFIWFMIKGILWNEAYSNAYRENAEFKLSIEHPEWDVDRIKSEAEEYVKKFPLELTYLDKFDISNL